MLKLSSLTSVKHLSRRPQLLDVPCETCVEIIPRDCKIGYHVDCKRGVLLFQRGYYPKGIVVVCKGTIKLSSISKSGKPFVVKLASPGDVLGMDANLPYEVTAESLTSCLLRVLPTVDVLRLIAESGSAGRCVTSLLARQHQADVTESCRTALSIPVTNRVANYLLKLRQGLNETELGKPFRLLLTHQEIAEVVGSTRETVTRSIQQFRQNGMIALNGREITVLQQGLLEQMGVSPGSRGNAGSECFGGSGAVEGWCQHKLGLPVAAFVSGWQAGEFRPRARWSRCRISVANEEELPEPEPTEVDSSRFGAILIELPGDVAVLMSLRQ